MTQTAQSEIRRLTGYALCRRLRAAAEDMSCEQNQALMRRAADVIEETHRAFARQNAYGYWEGCIEYPSGTVSAVTNAKHTESAALGIAQRMVEGADERWAEKERRHKRLRRNWRLYGSIMPGTVSVPANYNATQPNRRDEG